MNSIELQQQFHNNHRMYDGMVKKKEEKRKISKNKYTHLVYSI